MARAGRLRCRPAAIEPSEQFVAAAGKWNRYAFNLRSLYRSFQCHSERLLLTKQTAYCVAGHIRYRIIVPPVTSAAPVVGSNVREGGEQKGAVK